MLKRIVAGMMVAALAGMLAGCGSQDTAGKAATTPQDSKKPVQDTKPVTLKMYTYQNFTDDVFNDMVAIPVKKKYPFITVDQIHSGDTKLDDLIGSGTVPDLINGWNGELANLISFNVLYDMSSLVKQHNLDLNRFEPVVLDAVRKMSDKGEVFGLPYTVQLDALYYNKDLFDKFGVPYPKDGLTWEDAIELGKKLTRKDGNTQYRGIDYEHISRLSFPLSPDVVDAKTDRANVDNNTWRQAFELGKQMLDIPGNMPKKVDSGSTDAFFKDKTIAMYASINWFDRTKDAIAGGLNLGVAQYPSYKDKPNTYGMVDAHYMLVTAQSKNKDAAMDVIETLTSDEVQLLGARKYAKKSSLVNPQMHQQFAADMPYLKGIDLQSIFKSKPAHGVKFSPYYGDSRKIIMKEYINYAKGEEDLNTALRKSTEAINKLIDDAKGK